jgi:hypothetical protein
MPQRYTESITKRQSLSSDPPARCPLDIITADELNRHILSLPS